MNGRYPCDPHPGDTAYTNSGREVVVVQRRVHPREADEDEFIEYRVRYVNGASESGGQEAVLSSLWPDNGAFSPANVVRPGDEYDEEEVDDGPQIAGPPRSDHHVFPAFEFTAQPQWVAPTNTTTNIDATTFAAGSVQDYQLAEEVRRVRDRYRAIAVQEEVHRTPRRRLRDLVRRRGAPGVEDDNPF